MPDPAKSGILDKIARAMARTMPPPEALPPEASSQTGGQFDPEWREIFGLAPGRKAAYQDFDLMEIESPVVSSALDAQADTAVSGAEGEAEDVYQIQFDEDKSAPSEKALEEMEALEKRCKIKSNARATIRDMAHKGDVFEEMVVDPSDMSIHSLNPMPPESIVVVPPEQIKASDDPAFIQYNAVGDRIADFRRWQVVQYGVIAKRTDLYGRSSLYSARRTYKQLQMIQDGLVVNRLVRASNRNAWMLPVGNMGATQAYAFAEDWMKRRRRYRKIDPKTGKLILANNPLDDETDLVLPTGEQVGTGSISVLQGQAGMDKIEDVMFFLKNLIAALKTPAAYLGFEEGTHDKNVITTIDVAFGRMVRLLQKAYGVGVRQLYDTQLALKGFKIEDLIYSLVFPPIGTVDEMRRWQVELLKAQVAQLLKTTQLIMDDEYLLRKVIEVEEDELKKILARNKKAKETAQQDAESNALFQSGLGAMNTMTAAASKAALTPADQGKEGPGRKGFGRVRELRVSSTLARAVDTAIRTPSMRATLMECRKLAIPVAISRPTQHVIAEMQRQDSFVGV